MCGTQEIILEEPAKHLNYLRLNINEGVHKRGFEKNTIREKDLEEDLGNK